MNSKLFDYISALPLVDSFELLPPRPELRQPRDIVAELMSDAPASVLLAAGLPPDKLELARGDRLSVREKWKIISRYWSLASHTTACRAAELAARELYGIDKLCAETIEAYDAAFRSTFTANRYEYILKERCRIEFALLFNIENGEPDSRYFKPAGDISGLVSPQSADDAQATGQKAGISVSAFDDYLEACTRLLKELATRCRVICCSESPLPLHASYSDARSAFAAMMGGSRSDGREAIRRYVYRYILSLAAEHEVTFRLDDGGADSYSHAETFKLYPKLCFDVLVSASPGRRELSRYAAVLPNVYANLSRVPLAAGEYLNFTPYSKLIYFGGGCRTVDAIYGCVLITREMLTRVLSHYISSGIFDIRGAEVVACALLCENARKIYGA